ncbi:hypothetical protein [Paenibacillus graminis]|nr:hypothetical protein [Paenibacillus graminis]MEC0167811.1 hypothetical protein [Paenibacillus graminis]
MKLGDGIARKVRAKLPLLASAPCKSYNYLKISIRKAAVEVHDYAD